VRAAHLALRPQPAAAAHLNIADARVSDAILRFRAWRPFFGPTAGAFTLADLLRFANEGP
jgi:hypothetical protein